LAVGYGKLDTFEDTNKPGEAVDEELAGGLVLFWSLRNPEYPEKVLRTSAPVTSLDFSKLSPMLLAVGLYNGDINVYDVKREGKEWSIPVESSTSMNMGTGHTDAVWHVKWVPRGNERVETLVTISSDGRVLQWAILKGLGVSTLMRLARSGSTDGWITRQASGLSFDFCPDDPTTYVVGTEEGSVHKCSVSYSEQYLETYQPHHGPVYRVSCSPHWPQVFLTCSADWSISLYHLNVRDKPIFSMRATEDSHFAINDICWCQDNSTVFAAVTQNGMLQIWDMSVSCLDPVVCYNTSQDDVTAEKKEEIEAPAEDELGLAGLLGRPSAGMPASGLRHEHKEEEKKETRIQRLVRNLASDGNTTSTGDTIPTSQRVLTSVRFSEAAPTVVVGDNKGTVTVYRVIDPVVQTQMGPLQQTEKLKNAVAALDPVAAELVKKVEAKAE
jgi:WD40 repeat protein